MFLAVAAQIVFGICGNLLRGDFAVGIGKCVNFMSGVFNRSRLVGAHMTCVGTYYALKRTQSRSNYSKVCLGASHEEMNVGVNIAKVFFYFSRALFAPGVNAVTAVALGGVVHQRLKHKRVSDAVIIVVPAYHIITSYEIDVLFYHAARYIGSII